MIHRLPQAPMPPKTTSRSLAFLSHCIYLCFFYFLFFFFFLQIFSNFLIEQHFFILHKASEKSTSSGKPRKRLDPCPTKLKEGDEGCLRMEAFQLVWSGIESSIKDVMRNMNAHVFNQIHSWVCDSFSAIKPIAPFSSPLGPFPIVTHATCCAQLFTALLLTSMFLFCISSLLFILISIWVDGVDRLSHYWQRIWSLLTISRHFKSLASVWNLMDAMLLAFPHLTFHQKMGLLVLFQVYWDSFWCGLSM